jgi:50S ribosomal protein L16 3-hydroxylase
MTNPALDPSAAARGPFSDEAMARFARQAWGQAMYVDRIADDDLAALRRELRDFDIRALIASAAGPVSLWFNDLQGHLRSADVPPHDAINFYAAGHTVYMPGVTSPLIEVWRAAMAAQLGRHPRNYLCSLFASQPNHRTGAHFDELENFTIQLAGTKRWRIAENPRVHRPTVNYSMGSPRSHNEELWLYADRPLPEAMPDTCREITLEPGSILYLPRGHWHEVVAPDQESLSLLIAFPSVTWLDALLPALRTLLLRRAPWREHAVFHGPPDRARLHALWQDLQRVIAATDPQVVLPPYRPDAAEAFVPNPLCTLGRYPVADDALDLVAHVHLGELSRREEARVPARWQPLLACVDRGEPMQAAELAHAFPALADELPEILRTLRRLHVLLAPASAPDAI